MIIRMKVKTLTQIDKQDEEEKELLEYLRQVHMGTYAYYGMYGGLFMDEEEEDEI